MPNETEKTKVEIMADMLKPITDYCNENKIHIAIIAGDEDEVYSFAYGTIDSITSLIVVSDSQNIKDIANIATAKILYENVEAGRNA
jgi:hypothetical protein